MGDVAIRVENLSKRYRIGQGERYYALRDTLARAFTAPFRRWYSHARSSASNSQSHDWIWALKEVSFDVKEGEVVGIIGRNGAGKSTLLKILSRITKPTEGLAEIHGRVGSLLEVGIGFHHELTGRENIFLNGAILGMKKTEILQRFDEIVAFAEVEKFIDTPVKHYSSGMYMRLAFAVAAHLEPEILLVDEVLAVGDAAFQKKCLGKMGEVAKEGRTVLFVSHNMAAIRQLCHTATLISGGQLVLGGDAREVAARYEGLLLDNSTAHMVPGVLYDAMGQHQHTQFAITRIEMRDEQGQLKPSLATWDPVCFRIHYHAPHALSDASTVFWLSSPEGVNLLLCSTRPDSNVDMAFTPGPGCVDCVFPEWPFAAGRYLVDAALAIPTKEYLCRLQEPVPLEVQPRDVFTSGRIMPEQGRALVAAPHIWRPGK